MKGRIWESEKNERNEPIRREVNSTFPIQQNIGKDMWNWYQLAARIPVLLFCECIDTIWNRVLTMRPHAVYKSNSMTILKNAFKRKKEAPIFVTVLACVQVETQNTVLFVPISYIHWYTIYWRDSATRYSTSLFSWFSFPGFLPASPWVSL